MQADDIEKQLLFALTVRDGCVVWADRRFEHPRAEGAAACRKTTHHADARSGPTAAIAVWRSEPIRSRKVAVTR